MATKQDREPAPFIWLQDYEREGEAACGCTLTRRFGASDNPAVVLCPLHAAAEKLLDFAKLYDSGRGTLEMLDRLSKEAIKEAEGK